ncbi:hypothetical protein QOT17_002381 [Balamuthia mandrillaris]
MGGTTSKAQRPDLSGEVLPPRIDLGQLCEEQEGNAEAGRLFCESMRQKGFAVIRLDAETQQAIQDYLAAALEFFEQPINYKERYSMGTRFNTQSKVNRGYLLVEHVKEYLKLGSQDIVPDQPSNFQETFDKAYEQVAMLTKKALSLLASYTAEGEIATKLDNTYTHFSLEMLNEINIAIETRSSISVINYFKNGDYKIHELEKQKKLKMKIRETHENETIDLIDNRQEQKENEIDINEPSNEMFIPSATHCDTGLLTAIVCAPVPGLQVKDKVTNEFLEVEKLVEPCQDMFIIMGNKIQQFCQHGAEASLFEPTVHRVMLPANTSRTSFLFFLDVGQV